MQHEPRKPFHNSRVSIGSAVHVLGALAPLLIHEFVADKNKAWRYVRISAAVTAVASGVLWRERVREERSARQQSDEGNQQAQYRH